MKRFCNACNIKRDENNYLKSRTACKSCNKKDRRKNDNKNTLIQNQQSMIDKANTNSNNRTLLVEPSFSGETYLILKILSRIRAQHNYLTTKSPPEQNSNSKIKIKEISDQIKISNKYENAIIVLMLF